jgi:hypothetical protein
LVVKIKNKIMAFSSPFMAKSPFHEHELGHKKKSSVEVDQKEELPQATKDSLQQKALERGKPFYSKKHKVYVEGEDGVLTNTPTNTDNYEKL